MAMTMVWPRAAKISLGDTLGWPSGELVASQHSTDSLISERTSLLRSVVFIGRRGLAGRAS